MAQRVKDPALSLLCKLDPWPRNLHMPQARPPPKKNLQKPVNIKLLNKDWPWCPDQQDKG